MSNKSAAKGTRAEHALIKVLNQYYDLPFKRVPLSGASVIKGDVFIPNKHNKYCIEVKSYKESAINHLLLSGVGKPLLEWIDQTLAQAEKMENEPLLFFKHDRSPFYVCTWDKPDYLNKYIKYNYTKDKYVYIAAAKDWLDLGEVNWIL